MDFAKSRGLECKEDAAHNVYVRKPASKGMEDRKGVILQAHLDMVPQKNNDKKFDFTKDPIDAYIDGEWVTADGTTLGADNGIGAAAILAVLEDDTLVHGPFEALFTATEETGMDGAFGLKKGLLRGDILLNLDSETEGELYVGCAGGLDANVTFKYAAEKTPVRNYTAAKITVKGLLAYSGIQIGCQRANANKVLFRFLNAASASHAVLLCSVDGGGLRHAIPREAEAVVMVKTKEYEAFAKELKAYEKVVKAEYAGIEDAVSVKIRECEAPAEMVAREVAEKLTKAVVGCPDGVQKMSMAMPGLVQTSSNLARVVSDGKAGQLQCLLRSSVNTEKGRAGRGHCRRVLTGRRQGAAFGQLRRMEPRHGLADPEGHDRFVQSPLRQATRRDGDSRRAGVRHHRQQLPQDGHDLVRPHDLLPAIARRRWRSHRSASSTSSWSTRCATSPKSSVFWKPERSNGSSLVNPVAGGGRGLDHFPQISRYLRDAQILCEPVFTEHKFHATELTVTAVNEGYRHIIVVGGDGTLHEVVNGLFIQQKVCPDEVLLAVVAVGTGNDWVRTFGISNRYQDAVKAISEGYSFLQDVGVVSYEESHYRQSRYMANVAGAGFDAHVVRKFSHLKKKGRKNRWIYTWCLVRQFFRYKSTGMKVWVDDRLVYNNLLLSIAIGICKYNGGGMQQLPEAVADDGMLDVSLIRPVHFWHLLFRFHYLFNGGIYRIRHILQERGSRIRIESSPEISVEVDGELLGETPLEFSILHKAIRIVVSKEFYDKRPETSCSCTVPEV